MAKGKEILGWSEPKQWRLATKDLAKAEGIRMFPIKECLKTFAMVGGLLFYKWSEADPEKRPSPFGLIIVIVLLCIALFALVRLKLALNKARTSLRENGILDGSHDSLRWIPYRTIEAFSIEEEEIGGRRMRLLFWLEKGMEDEQCSPLPDVFDQLRVIEILKSKGVEYRVTLNEAE